MVQILLKFQVVTAPVALKEFSRKKKFFENLPFVSKLYRYIDFEMLKLEIFSWGLFELTLQNVPKITIKIEGSDIKK